MSSLHKFKKACNLVFENYAKQAFKNTQQICLDDVNIDLFFKQTLI